MTKISALHQGWMQDPEYQKAHDALEEEFALATALIAARAQPDDVDRLVQRGFDPIKNYKPADNA